MEMDKHLIVLKGTVERITYKNNDSGYTVFVLNMANDDIVCTGTVPYVNEGDSVTVNGEYVMHPSYGQQFKCEFCEVSVPETESQVLKFLSSGAIKGIGPATALKIVERFREETLYVIEKEPIRLTEIKGISKDKALNISEQYANQFGVREIMINLAKFNISPLEATKIFKKLGPSAVELINDNPFILCEQEIGFSFERADDIAETLSFSASNPFRITAGIIFVLKSNLNNGHTCLPYDKVVVVSSKLLGVDQSEIDTALNELVQTMRLYVYDIEGRDFVFLPEFASAEEFISSRILTMLGHNTPLYGMSEQELKFVQSRLGIEFDPCQIAAVNEAMNSNVFILTGGPGTGKTTTLNAIIEILDNRKLSIALAAPTGRAAKRMTELTSRDASTIHRLLEVEWGDDSKQTFAKNKKNPLDFDVIIVDETSMVDVLLFRALLEATRLTTRIILVGDSDQLPSVGAGNVLNDLIASETVPCVRLSKIFRQSEDSSIVTFAHDIIKGVVPENFERSGDFYFIRRGDAFSTSATVADLCSDRLPLAYGFSPMNDIQVLCPSRKNENGTVNLNNLLQAKLNPLRKNESEINFKGYAFRPRDKVMQIKNDYDIIWENDRGEVGTGIFNGDIGFIESVDIKNRLLTVRYDDKIATYYEDNFNLIELAYAVTVHKSQGCEFNSIIIPLFDTPVLLRYRNLLYTAITRAKKLIVLIGDPAIFVSMIENDKKTLRYTALKDFLKR